MDLTKSFVKDKRPCADGFRWFLRHHADGSDYQPLLDALVSAGRVDDACWLLTQFGPTDGVLRVDTIDAEAIVFAGTLEVQGNIEVASIVRAGRAIHAGGGIRAGQSIIAGEEISRRQYPLRWHAGSRRRYQGRLGYRSTRRDSRRR